jgi:hypothetical protein
MRDKDAKKRPSRISPQVASILAYKAQGIAHRAAVPNAAAR